MGATTTESTNSHSGSPPPAKERARSAALPALVAPQSQLSIIWRRLRQDAFALIGAGIILFTLFLAVAAPVVAPHDPLQQDSSIRLAPIGTSGHPLGTDGNGRDILSRLIYGSRTALLIALVPVAVAAVFGIAMGLVAGYFGGWSDSLLMRFSDILFAFPAVLLAIAIVAALGPTLVNAMLALAIVFVPAFARLVRSSVLSLREREFVVAARASGSPTGRLLIRHVLANALPTVIVFATLQTGQMIIFGSALSFLGLGVQPPTPDWGTMSNDGRQQMLIAPWVTTLPGIAIFCVSVGFNLLGDGLRDALDPTLRT
ncbi:MAG: ABC transporter permease [Thermomicrobiales bacterium]|nr:ABC transporter permease [Thermomicrobiales bacterium]